VRARAFAGSSSGLVGRRVGRVVAGVRSGRRSVEARGVEGLVVVWVQVLGYAASALIVAGLLMSSLLRLRLLGLAGAILFASYGLLIGAVPVVVTNGTIVAVHLYHLRRILRDRALEVYFEVVPWRITGAYVPRFLRFWNDDIARFQPDFDGLRDEHKALIVLRDVVPVGLVLYRELGDGTAHIDLDYVTPAHRDQRAASYVFDPAGPLPGLGIARVTTTGMTEAHARYLDRVGFVRDGDTYAMDLTVREMLSG
jgi:hypothetical protein